MTYDSRESSRYQGAPFELYWFATEEKSWRLTSADRAIEYGGSYTYEPTAIIRTATEQGQEIKSGSLTLTIPKEHMLAQEFVSGIPSTPMSIVIYRGHEGEEESEVIVNFTGFISRAQLGDVCELTAVPESEMLKRRVPSPRYQRQCNHVLYDTGCQVDKETFRRDITITAVDGDTIQAAEFDAEEDGWFTAGYIEKGSERRMILSHVGNTVVLLTPLPGLAVDDEISAYAGCQRDAATCETKFDNLVHFNGYEHIPRRNPFDSGAE